MDNSSSSANDLNPTPPLPSNTDAPNYPASTSQFPQPALTRFPSNSELPVHARDDINAPDAAAALGGVHSNIKMDSVARVGHRRRRSSLMNSLDTSTRTTTKRSPRTPLSPTKGRNSLQEMRDESKMGDKTSDDESKSTSEDVELDDLSEEDGLQDDEETGLTGKDKRKRKKRRRRNTLLDQRIAGDGTLSVEERQEADQSVLQKSLVNSLLIGLWYLFSLSISIYNKWMFDPKHLDFTFPLFTTCVHMLVQFGLASLVLFFFPRFRPRHDSLSNPNNTRVAESSLDQHQNDSKKPLMTRMFYFTRIGPCGMATGLDIGLGNMSLKFISLTFYTMCKSSALAFVLLFAFLFRLESPSWRLVAIIATMTAGVVMMVAGEVAFSALGFILVISAAFFSGFRWALTQILLLRNPATSNPFSSIFYLAPVMFTSLLVIAIPVEGFPALWQGLVILVEKKGPILGPLILLFPGLIAFCMTSSEFALLQRTSVVTLSIAGIFKEVVTISAAGLVFHDPLTPINISGLFVTIGSIAAYNYIKIRKMREDAHKDAQLKHIGERDDSGSDADGEDDGGSDDEDWATNGRVRYITSDGDVLPPPDRFTVKHTRGESSLKPPVPSGEQRKEEVGAAVGKDLSD